MVITFVQKDEACPGPDGEHTQAHIRGQEPT